jgi:hypothetical protein
MKNTRYIKGGNLTVSTAWPLLFSKWGDNKKLQLAFGV